MHASAYIVVCLSMHCVNSVFSNMLTETGKTPNKYTIAMGELIRKAREEVGLNQDELAEKIYRKRLAVSQMEMGKWK
jgi:ribosome-binding protein aMBF1 (putative translation factor)